MEPLEVWFEKTKPRRDLVDNLKINLEQYAEGMTQEDQDSLLRLNLIMIRQCMLTDAGGK